MKLVHQTPSPDYITSVGFSTVGNMAAIGCDRGKKYLKLKINDRFLVGSIEIFDLEASYDNSTVSIAQEELSILKWRNENVLMTGCHEGFEFKFLKVINHNF